MEHQPQTLCAWCNKVPADKLLDHGLVSHGICRECTEKVMRALETSHPNPVERECRRSTYARTEPQS